MKGFLPLHEGSRAGAEQVASLQGYSTFMGRQTSPFPEEASGAVTAFCWSAGYHGSHSGTEGVLALRIGL